MTHVSPASAVSVRRSARFVPWVRAWRAGLVPYDEVGPTVTDGEEHVLDLPDVGLPVSLGEGLSALSRTHPDEIRLVLPVPGDPRGLPGPGELTGAALLAGEAVIAGRLGLVPEVTEHMSGSGDVWHTVTWRAHPVPPGHDGPAGAEPVTPGEAEAELAEALARATIDLDRIGATPWRPELGDAIAALRKPDHRTELPPGYDGRCRRLFARATVLDRMVALAESEQVGAGLTVHETNQRTAVLRPLAVACRRALTAACNAPLTA